MIKPTPNPPETHAQIDTDSESSSRKPQMADRRPNPIFTIAPNVNNETLLVHACETLASASVMASELAFILSGPKCSLALGDSTDDCLGGAIGEPCAGSGRSAVAGEGSF
jgi:hypothetical protein